MRIVGNKLNNDFFENILVEADSSKLQAVRLAVAYVRRMDKVFELAQRRNVPLSLYCLFDGNKFPAKPVMKRFLERERLMWHLFLTANFYHPKIYWFEGVGAYIGSANLTTNGWFDNLECGIWLTSEDLERENWQDSLTDMFSVIEDRCTPAQDGHLDVYEQLGDRSEELRLAQKAFDTAAASALRNLRGSDKPIAPPPSKSRGGAAGRKFVERWNQSLTLLRKLADAARRYPSPAWVAKDVHPAFIQDQATERWYDYHVRKSGDSLAEIETLRSQNLGRSDAAVDELFELWQHTSADDFAMAWVNDHPQEAHELLSRESLRSLDEDKLTEIISRTHAARAHARQMPKAVLGLSPSEDRTQDERNRLFAQFLFQQKTDKGKTVADTLLFAIWGDAQNPECAERVWEATHSPDWKMARLGPNILGELIGYARPNDFPPRNDRVAKTLKALGFPGV